jgi:hypothetical protein
MVFGFWEQLLTVCAKGVVVSRFWLWSIGRSYHSCSYI